MDDGDEIPDLLPGMPGSAARPEQLAGARPEQRAGARPLASVASVPPEPVVSVRRLSNPPPTDSSASSLALLELAPVEERAAPSAAEDELEFDLLGATSQRAEALGGEPASGLSLEPTRAEVPGAPRPARSVAPLDGELEVPPPARSVAPLDGELEVPPRASVSPLPASASTSRRSSYPAQPSSSPSGSRRGDSRPAPASFAPLSTGGAADWDWDEALGPTPGVELEVPKPRDDEGPWPRGRTPSEGEFVLEPSEVTAAAGFGAPPRGALGAPLYFVRVTLGRRQLRVELERVESELREAERGRDRLLAGLAEGLRGELASQERFARAYAEVSPHDELIRERERGLERVGQEGQTRMESLDARLGEARELTLAREREAEQARVILAEAERLERRARAQLNRAQIELRNVQELARQRAGVGAVMPQDLALRFVTLESESKQASGALADAEAEKKQRERALRAAEEEARRARADERRLEAEREGYVMTHEGDVSGSAGALGRAHDARARAFADIGRALLELCGEVPVPLEQRARIAQADRLVEAAARKRAVLLRASASADDARVAVGRRALAWVAVGLVLASSWAALR